jgi:glycerol-3-phosphate dehydrogenase (NAD(P)+)
MNLSPGPRGEVARAMLVAGAGSWGTALAILLARKFPLVYLWGHDPAHIQTLLQDRENSRYLPGIPVPGSLLPIADLTLALPAVQEIILAVPLRGLRGFCQGLAAWQEGRKRIALTCKGLETGTHRLAHEVIEAVLGPGWPVAVVSGPSFAREVAAGLPTALTVASRDAAFAGDLIASLHGGAFRAYGSDDIIGVEVGGAVKNVLAIAAGVADGLAFGANTRAALITRGLAEIMRLGVALGGQRETFMGLSGLGDLVLTCTDDQSRNRRFGLRLARGETVQQALSAIGQVVEGVNTAYEIEFLAGQNNIEMPITEQVVRLLKGECTPREAVQALLAREPKQEFE